MLRSNKIHCCIYPYSCFLATCIIDLCSARLASFCPNFCCSKSGGLHDIMTRRRRRIPLRRHQIRGQTMIRHPPASVPRNPIPPQSAYQHVTQNPPRQAQAMAVRSRHPLGSELSRFAERPKLCAQQAVAEPISSICRASDPLGRSLVLGRGFHVGAHRLSCAHKL